MTATPKELLDAARDLENHAYDMMQTHRHMESEDEQFVLWSKQNMLADHIRSTVRADDDEPMTLSEFPSRINGCVVDDHGAELIIDGGEGGHIFFTPTQESLRVTIYGKSSSGGMATIFDPTWGHFRTLCRALGLTLPEVPNAG